MTGRSTENKQIRNHIKKKTIQKNKKVNNTDGEVKKSSQRKGGRKTDRNTFVYREKGHKRQELRKIKCFKEPLSL